jgi:DDE superfamily endonuclease.
MWMGGQYQRPLTLKGVLHLPLEYPGQSNSWTDRKIFKEQFFHTFIPSVKEHFCKTGMPEDSKFILLLDNCIAHSLI